MTRRPAVEFAPLADHRVVDLSTWIAGAYCSRLLADGGAPVRRIEPEGGHPLRTWSASGTASNADGGADAGVLFGHLCHDQISVDAGRLDDELAGADVCVWSPGGALDPHTIRAAHPHLSVVSITPFGLDTPWSDRPATEFTLQAWSGGIIGLGRGDPDRAPVHVGGQVGEWLSGAYAAVGLLASLRSGEPGLVDVSMLEVQAMCLTYYPVTFHDVIGRPMRKRRALTVPGVAAAADGMVGLGVGTGQQWLDFCVMAGHPEWAEDASLFTERGALAGAIDEWVGERTMDEVLDLAGAFRIPNAPIVDGANALHIGHFEARDAFGREDGAVAPRPPLRITSGPQPADHGAARTANVASPALPCTGLRVLDMTAYWAGPSASHVLALLGAEVIHLESAGRPDGARLVGGRPRSTGQANTDQANTEQHWEQGPIFAALNTNKSSLTLDFATPAGLDLLRRVIATCDVVIENYTPRVLDSLGLTDEALRELRDDLIVVRMPGFGLDGPWRDQPAFAFVIEDASGLTWLTGHPDRHPVEPYCIGDSNAGVHAAYGLFLALAHRDATGVGVTVEAAMVDAALSITAEQVLEHSVNGVRLERTGNRGPAAAPQNLYDCMGPDGSDRDEFGREPNRVAIAVATDAQWHALRSTLGQPGWADDPTLADHAGRAAAHDMIDDQLAAWCRGRTADDVVAALWAAGVPVAEVRQPHRQPDLPPMQARDFFEELDHPVMGSARYSTLPFRLDDRPARLHVRPAPLLGEHTAELLGELGIDAAQLHQLIADGVVATTLEGPA